MSNSNNNFFKYIKYKNKYLKLKYLYGGGNIDDIDYITTITKQYFTTPVINQIDDENIEITINCGSKNDITLYINKTEEYLSIETLMKCFDITGTNMLENIILFATDLKLKKITLIDASFFLFGNILNKDISISYILETIESKIEPKYILDCKYNLGYLYILLHGESWYNKFGFISENYINEVKQNNKILQYNLQKLIEEINKKEIFNLENNIILLKRYKDDYFKNPQTIRSDMLSVLNNLNIDQNDKIDYMQKIDKYLLTKIEEINRNNLKLFENIQNYFGELYDSNPDQTIQELMKKIYNKYIKNSTNIICTSDIAITITSLINKTGLILTYNSTLEKRIDILPVIKFR
jgi:hypothetical protein